MNLDDQMLSINNCLNTIAKMGSLSYMITMKDDVTGATRVWRLEGWREEQQQHQLPLALAVIRPVLRQVKTIHWDHYDNRELITQYYSIFTSISQLCCKDLAKQWIKVIQPNKQASHPYKLKDRSKPDWWPHHVHHIEPDHLEREGRIDLLILILRNPNVSLRDLVQRTVTISWRRVSLRLLDEVYYIAAYDRYYYYKDRDVSLNHNFLRGVFLVVSDLRRPDNRITMSLLIFESDTSDRVYEYPWSE